MMVSRKKRIQLIQLRINIRKLSSKRLQNVLRPINRVSHNERQKEGKVNSFPKILTGVENKNKEG